jgi:hypothetical protein
MFQDLRLEPKVRYRLQGWFRGGVPDKGLRFRVGSAFSSWSGHSQDWQRLELRFKAGPDETFLRVEFDLPDGAQVDLDQVSLEPLSGKVPPAPKPVIQTEPGTYAGPIHIRMENSMPDSTLRYTLDGSDPHEFSTPYQQPFFLHGPAEVRAAVFRASHARSEIASAHYGIESKFGEGVPFTPVGWGQPVNEWWATHPYNPRSPQAFNGPVRSPEPRIDVSKVRAAHPGSQTGGIEEALALLPENGGTLWFPKSGSPYVVDQQPTVIKNYYLLDASIHILRRSNIHFLSDGATIEVTHEKSEGAGHPGIFSFCSMEYADSGGFQNPVRNFYFKGLTFDGGGKGAVSAFLFRHCGDILFEDCRFVNFTDPTDRYHPGLINATSMTDNIWLRRCFLDSAKFGVYWDGVHNGGFVDCDFGPGLVKSAILLLTNNDMVHYSAVQRSCQYIVVADSRFNQTGNEVLTATAANVLLENNDVDGTYRYFVNQTGRGHSNMRPFVRYNGNGFYVVNNEIERVHILGSFKHDCAQLTRHGQFPMESVFRDNRVERADRLLELVPNGDYGRVESIRMENNHFAEVAGPLVEIADGREDRVFGINLRDNEIGDFSGNELQSSDRRVLSLPEVEIQN